MSGYNSFTNNSYNYFSNTANNDPNMGGASGSNGESSVNKKDQDSFEQKYGNVGGNVMNNYNMNAYVNNGNLNYNYLPNPTTANQLHTHLPNHNMNDFGMHINNNDMMMNPYMLGGGNLHGNTNINTENADQDTTASRSENMGLQNGHGAASVPGYSLQIPAYTNNFNMYNPHVTNTLHQDQNSYNYNQIIQQQDSQLGHNPFDQSKSDPANTDGKDSSSVSQKNDQNEGSKEVKKLLNGGSGFEDFFQQSNHSDMSGNSTQGLAGQMQHLDAHLNSQHTTANPSGVGNFAMGSNAQTMFQSNDLGQFDSFSHRHIPKHSSVQSSSSSSNHKQSRQKDILDDFQVTISSLSVEPLSGKEILDKIKARASDVQRRYLPCVEFLVLCQQELRTGLDQAIRRRGRNSAADVYFKTNFEKLPRRFYERNVVVIPEKELNEAIAGLRSLVQDAKNAQREAKGTEKLERMKNAFLGGMRDGESWGLRRWLSKNGGALHICNDIELIWGGLRVLDKSDEKVIEIAKRIRPIMKNTLMRLKNDVPKAYQEISSAHPYLPFFHRLESALKGLSEFDPEDDDVICLDDSDDEDIKEEPKPNVAKSSSAKKVDSSTIPSLKKKTFEANNDDGDDSDLEILHVTKKTEESKRPSCESPMGLVGDDFWTKTDCACIQGESCIFCGGRKSPEGLQQVQAFQAHIQPDIANKQQLAEIVDALANSIEEGKEVRPLEFIDHFNFWSNNYPFILRLLRDLILSNAARVMLEPTAIEESFVECNDLNKYYATIRNPIGFRHIVKALVESSTTQGKFHNNILPKWNLFDGKTLVEATDLVLLNTLAFIGKQDNSVLRKEIMKLRKVFWKAIRDAGCNEKKQMPIRRTENSQFLLLNK